MIDSEQAEKAVDWLRDNAPSIAKGRADRLYMEQWIKTVKATLQQKQTGMSVAASEIIALASPEYLSALQAYRQAIETDEYNRFVVAAKEAKIEAWRSQESTRRAESRIFPTDASDAEIRAKRKALDAAEAATRG